MTDPVQLDSPRSEPTPLFARAVEAWTIASVLAAALLVKWLLVP